MEKKKIGAEIRVLANLIGRNFNEINSGGECYDLTGPQSLILAYLYKHQNDDVFQQIPVQGGLLKSKFTPPAIWR